MSQIHVGLLEEYEQVLRKLPASGRQAFIDGIAHLLEAFQGRECGATEKGTGTPQEKA